MKYTLLLLIIIFIRFSLAEEKLSNSEATPITTDTITEETSENKNPHDRFVSPDTKQLHEFLDKNKDVEMEVYKEIEEDGSIGIHIRPRVKPQPVQQVNISPPKKIQYDFCNTPRQEAIKTAVSDLLNKPCQAITPEDLKRMRSLPLNNLNITQVSQIDFDELNNVTMISLHNNRLKEIPVGTFNHLQKLTYLDLSHNQIEQINTAELNNIPQLSYLDLSHNLLRDFPALNNPQLTHLDLSYNFLNRITKDTFSPKPQFDYYTPDTPSTMWENLITLNLSYNRIDQIELGALSYLYTLVNLNLSHNYIEEISFQDLAGLYSLVNLNISYNQISELAPGIFNQLHQLVTLDISNNELNSLEWQAFENLKVLEVLKYSNNPLDQIIINPQRDFYKTGSDKEWYDCWLTSCWNNYAYIAIDKKKYKYMKCRGNDSDSHCHQLAEMWNQDLNEGYFLVVKLKHNGQHIDLVQRHEEFPFDIN